MLYSSRAMESLNNAHGYRAITEYIASRSAANLALPA